MTVPVPAELAWRAVRLVVGCPAEHPSRRQRWGKPVGCNREAGHDGRHEGWVSDGGEPVQVTW